MPLATENASVFKTARPPLRILVVAPEFTSLPPSWSRRSAGLSAKVGGLADVTSSLLKGLDAAGVEVHLAAPHYRSIFGRDADTAFKLALAEEGRWSGKERLHLAEDRSFYYRTHVYGGPEAGLTCAAFQREVINHVIPRVAPDLIHCHDWMTGLIPAFAKQHGIPCVFTVHNVHTDRQPLSFFEDRGIDAAAFWKHLYFDYPPVSYEETRGHNPCDLLASAIHAADHVNVVSPTFLSEVVHGMHSYIPESVRGVLRWKAGQGAASGIVNAPEASCHPSVDPHLHYRYTPESVQEGKSLNKMMLQDCLGLSVDPGVPVLFWPSRLDPVQKGCELLTDQLHRLVTDYESLGLQVVAVADGPSQCHFHHIIGHHGLSSRVACVDFDESLSRLAFAGSDFVLMPSLFEPCGLPQMIGARYGSLPIARNTGGLHDTVHALDPDGRSGNGFLFDHYDGGGFRWAIDRALEFYRRPEEERWAEVRRVMEEAAVEFSEETMIARYMDLYEQILQRPLLPECSDGARTLTEPLPVAPPVRSSEHSFTVGERVREVLAELSPLGADGVGDPA